MVTFDPLTPIHFHPRFDCSPINRSSSCRKRRSRYPESGKSIEPLDPVSPPRTARDDESGFSCTRLEPLACDVCTSRQAPPGLSGQPLSVRNFSVFFRGFRGHVIGPALVRPGCRVIAKHGCRIQYRCLYRWQRGQCLRLRHTSLPVRR